MRGKQWPRSKQIEVFESYALSESLAVTSRETGVPKSTVKRWVEQEKEEIDRIRARNHQVAERAIAGTLEERMKEIADFGEELRERARELLGRRVVKVTPGGIASLARAGVEIELRGLGKPTESIELRGRLLDEAIERELARLITPGEKGAFDDSSESA